MQLTSGVGAITLVVGNETHALKVYAAVCGFQSRK